MSDADRTRGQVHPIRGDREGIPPPGGPVRRLAAILAADIAGYSRLMQLDEEGTYARVMRQRPGTAAAARVTGAAWTGRSIFPL